MKTLLIETSTNNCSIGLAEGPELLIAVEEAGERKHSEVLNVFIEDALDRVGWQPGDLQRVAVGQGPGSYTGLRIGVSTAKAFSYALDIPLVGMPSLQVLSRQIKQEVPANDGFYCPMLDARRMEVYTAVYDNEGDLRKPVQALVLNHNNLSKLWEGYSPLYVSGEGAAKASDYLQQWPGVTYCPIHYPSVKGMASLADEQFKLGHTADVASFEPFYLKAVAAGKQQKLQQLLNK